MKYYNYEGKTVEELTLKAMQELNVNENEIIIEVIEEKGGLLKKAKIKVCTISDAINYIKDVILEITKLMNITANLEVRRRENSVTIKLFSDNNAILIGKNGRTISALQLIIKHIASEVTKNKINILLDVEDYKEKRAQSLKYLATKIAREVRNTKIEVKMDRMNSYERRIIHEALADDKYVITTSVGEEPNRCVVVKPKEDE